MGRLPIFLALVAVSCLAQPATTPQQTYPDWAKAETNIPYDKYKDTVLDIAHPKEGFKGKRPGVVVLHGGGWIQSNKESAIRTLCLPYLERGFVVANVEYRVAKVATAPGAVTDTLMAIEWFRKNAGRYNVDPNRIVVTGASAGGHLALIAGMAPKSAKLGPVAKVAAVINCYGIPDVADVLDGPHRQDWAVQWVPEQPGRMELARRVSPLTYVRKNVPPILTLHGEADTTAPYEQAVKLTKALQAAGADAELISVPKAGHGFSQAAWVGLNEQVFAFLKARGVLR